MKAFCLFLVAAALLVAASARPPQKCLSTAISVTPAAFHGDVISVIGTVRNCGATPLNITTKFAVTPPTDATVFNCPESFQLRAGQSAIRGVEYPIDDIACDGNYGVRFDAAAGKLSSRASSSFTVSSR